MFSILWTRYTFFVARLVDIYESSIYKAIFSNDRFGIISSNAYRLSFWDIPYCSLYNDAAKILASCGFCKAFGIFVAFCLVFLRCFVWCFCGNSFGVFAQFAIPCGSLRQRRFKIELPPRYRRMRFRKCQSKEAKTKTLNVITLRLQHGQGFARVREGTCSCNGVDRLQNANVSLLVITSTIFVYPQSVIRKSFLLFSNDRLGVNCITC